MITNVNQYRAERFYLADVKIHTHPGAQKVWSWGYNCETKGKVKKDAA